MQRSEDRAFPPVVMGRGAIPSASPGPTAEIVLRAGDGVAVLVNPAASTREGRTTDAQSALRRLTGDERIVINRRPSGRPALCPPFPELGVSLSHRDGALLAAFSPTVRVGTDIEPDDATLDARTLAADHFTPREAHAVAALSAAGARELFLRLWVAKEAALKLTGRGIHDGLHWPDLSAQSATLMTGDAAAEVAGDVPYAAAVAIVVRRLERPGSPALYCALAVER